MKQTIKNIEVKDDEIIITAVISKEEYGQNPLFNYTFEAEVKKELVRLLAEKVWQEQGEKIKEEVLKKVDWPEIVRSEVAQKVIQAVATGKYGKDNY